MNDDPSDRRESHQSPETDGWIDRIAESEGLSREEVVEQLVSSYWTLKEMHGLMGLSEEGVESADLPLDLDRIYSESVADDVEEIVDRLDRLEDAVEAGGTADVDEVGARVEMLAQRIAAVEESLAERVGGLEGRFDEEFDNLETILDYLIETTDDLGERVQSADEAQEAARADREEQRRLVELKRLASRLGVRSAKCEYCDATVEIALLPTPHCPQCDRQFTDIQPATGWFGFGTDRLTVSDQPYLNGTDAGESADADDAGSGDGDPFEWGDDRD